MKLFKFTIKALKSLSSLGYSIMYAADKSVESRLSTKREKLNAKVKEEAVQRYDLIECAKSKRKTAIDLAHNKFSTECKEIENSGRSVRKSLFSKLEELDKL